jgi:hypothetical protein
MPLYKHVYFSYAYIVPINLYFVLFYVVQIRGRLKDMARKGYRTITVREAIYNQIQSQAKKTHRTVPEAIAHWAETCPLEVS